MTHPAASEMAAARVQRAPPGINSASCSTAASTRLVAHEVGHALGIGASPTYLALVSTAGTEFIGPIAVGVFGGPVPLESDSGHLLLNLTFAGNPVLMDPTSTRGSRLGPSTLEFAILSDIGYEIAP